jgi:hypothetical protein
MNLFTVEDLNLLIESSNKAGACGYISMFMPTYRSGADMRQGPARLKNLTKQAEEKLAATGVRSSDTGTMLSSVRSLANDSFFWQNQADGLAVFIGPDVFRYYRVPITLKELSVVSSRFHIKPLYPLLMEDGRFYILTVSQKEVKMFQCTRFGYREVVLPESVPVSLAEATKYEELERTQQFHGHLGDRVYHGHIGLEASGAIMTSHGRTVTEENKDRLSRYFRDIDRGLREIMHDETAPLIFSGVDYLFPIYKQANTYQRLLDTVVPGNPGRLSIRDIHSKCLDVLKPIFGQAKAQAIRRYDMLMGTGLATTEAREIVENSFYGKIDTLLVDESRELWGVFNRESGTAAFHAAPEPCDEDLLDFAVTNTITKKGSTFVLKRDEIPGLTVAAILRK